MAATEKRQLGLGRGKVFPARNARQLLNPLRRLIQPPGRLIGNLHLARDARVLELGCGPGYFSPTIALAVARGHVDLFDFQREMLQMAHRQMRRRGLANFDCVQGDGMALPFHSGVFDAVVLVTVLGEVPDPAVCLREAWRTLKAGGLVAISETRGDADFNSIAAVRSLAEAAGFQFERRHGPRWNYTAIFRKRA